MTETLRKNCGRVVVLWLSVVVVLTTGHEDNTSLRQKRRRTTQLDPKTVEIKEQKRPLQQEWTQVSVENDYGNYLEQHQENYNTHPLLFQHCRPGQCRHIHEQVDEATSMWKLTEHEEDGTNRRDVRLSNLTDVLNYFPNHIIEDQSTKSCNIFFVGDSMSSDLTMAASCQLLNSGYTLKSINLQNKFYMGTVGQYGNDLNVKTELDLYPGIDHMLLGNQNAALCPRVLLIYSWAYMAAEVLDDEVLTDVRKTGGVMVYNEGVHCNGPNTDCISKGLQTNLLPLVSGENAQNYYNWKILFRETEPQHFNSPGGAFDMALYKKTGKLCGPISGEPNTRYRNQEAVDYLTQQNLLSRVKIISQYEQLIPLYQIHYPHDCTHYCYAPYRFDLTWDGMLRALHSYEDEVEVATFAFP